MPVGLGTAVGYLQLDISGFAKGVDSAISGMDLLEKKIKTASQGFQTIGEMFTKTGTALTAGFTAPVIGAAAASVKFGSEFDKQMSNVKAVTGATVEEFEAMREAAIKWGEKTVYTATEAGEALYYMGLAGWDSKEAIDGLGPVLNLAAAGNLELGRTSDIVTDALTAFGLTANDAAMFTDVLSAAMSNSNTDVDMLGESFKYVAPVAGAFGYSIQDVALALGIFANNGVKSSQAGTGLRQALNALINPSEKAAILMDKYGVSLFNADGTTKSFMTVMEELRGTFGNVSVNAEEVSKYIDELGLDLDTVEGETAATEAVMKKFGHALPITDMENLSAIVKIFGVRALPGMLSVINASEEDFYGLAEKINGSGEAFVKFGDDIYTMEEALERFGDRVYNDPSFEVLGSAAGMAATQMDNLSGDWAKFTSALGTSQIIISDMAKGVLRDLIQRLTEIVTWFNNLDEEQREQIAKWALIVASIGPVFLAVGKLITGIVGLVNTFKTLKSAFSAVSPVFTKLASDISGFMALAGEQGLMATIEGLTGVTGGMIATFAAVAAAVVALIAAFVNLWKNNEEFRNKIIGIWEGIKAKFEEAGQRIVDIFNELGFSFEDFEELMSAAIDGLKALWDGFCELLAPVFTGAFAIIGDVIGGLVDMFVGVIEVIVGIVKGFKDGDWSMLWQGVGDIVEAVVSSTIGILDHFGEAVWDIFSTISKWLGADWDFTWEEAKQAVADWFYSIVEWLVELPGKIANFFNNIGEAIKSFFTSVGEWIVSIPEKIFSLITTIASAINTFVSNIIQWVSELPGKIAEFLLSILNTVAEWGINMVNKAIEVGTNFLASVIKFFSELPYNIGYFIGYALTTVAEWVTNMVNKAKEMAQNFVQSIVDFFILLPGKILNFITSAYNNVVQWATNMVNKAYEMAQSFLNNIVSFFTLLPGKILNFITSAYNNVKQWATNMVNKAIEMARDFLNNIISFFMLLPGKILDFITSAYNNVKSWATNMINKAKDMASTFLSNVVSYFTLLPGKVLSFLTSTINNVINWVSNMKKKATEAAKGFFDNIVSGLVDLPKKMTEIGGNIVDGVWNGIKAAKDTFVKNIKDFFSGIVDGAKDALGIKSPSRVFRDQIGKWIPPGIGEGFAAAMPGVIRDMQNEIDDGVDSLSVDGADADVSIQNFANVYKDVFEDLVIWFESMEDRMAVAIQGLVKYFKYLMYVRKIIGDDDEFFKIFVLGDNDNKPKKPTNNNSVNNPIIGGGDTYNFYSPKPIDEIQAARMLKNTKRDLAEGFN